jgi:hypothetical protein
MKASLFLAGVAVSLSLPGVAHAGHHGASHSSHTGGIHAFHHGSLGSFRHFGYGYPSYTYSRTYAPDYSYGSSVASHRSTAPSLASEVQIALARLGYYRGPIDGIIGSGTRRALRSFQITQRLPVTGLIDRPTLDALPR